MLTATKSERSDTILLDNREGKAQQSSNETKKQTIVNEHMLLWARFFGSFMGIDIYMIFEQYGSTRIWVRRQLIPCDNSYQAITRIKLKKDNSYQPKTHINRNLYQTIKST